MKRIGNKIIRFEPFILDVSEGILVGSIAGFMIGILMGAFLWSLLWQAWPTAIALPDIFFAGKTGFWQGVLLGGLLSFSWRLKLFLREG